MKHNILLIDDDPAVRTSMKMFLEKEGFFVKAVAGGDEGVAHIRQKTIPFSLALVDYHMPELNGALVIKQLQELQPNLTLLGFSGDDSQKVHNDSLDSGALMLIPKDIENEKLLSVIHRHCREFERKTKPLSLPNISANKSLIQSVGMIGVSEHLADIAKLILKFSVSEQSVLIRGANGTGKEKVAVALHENSSRSRGPFLTVNCAAIVKDLVESELFGHAKGSFSGAHANKIGKFQAADNGTLFLDEIGDMPLPAQATLLRVLQEKEVTPVGSNETKKVNVRIIAATNSNLEEKILKEEFRQDLFYRLNGLPIKLKSLKERAEDIPYLVEHFLQQENNRTGQRKSILESTVTELQKKSWPGNIRELISSINRLHALVETDVINNEALEYLDESSLYSNTPSPEVDYETLRIQQDNAEKTMILKSFKTSKSLSETAKRLGINRSMLRSRLKSLKIKNPFSEAE